MTTTEAETYRRHTIYIILDALRRLYAFVGSSSYRISLMCMVVDYLVLDTVGNLRLLKLLLMTGSRKCFLNIRHLYCELWVVSSDLIF